jgi:hypothetical protein
MPYLNSINELHTAIKNHLKQEGRNTQQSEGIFNFLEVSALYFERGYISRQLYANFQNMMQQGLAYKMQAHQLQH